MKKNNMLIEKSNILNYFTCLPNEKMGLNEIRFFCLYLSKLNARNTETRKIEISIDEFKKIFNITLDITLFSKTLSNIMRRAMYIYDSDTQKYKMINLYSCFEWKDNFEGNIIEVSANSDIMPFLWSLTGNYTSYRLYNISKLNTVSKIRLYEILCQYKYIGEKIIEVDELQRLLQTDYKEFKFFNQKALSPAIKDINKYTDITVTYEKITQKRRVTALKFTIKEKREDTQKIDISEPTEEEKEIPKIPQNASDYFTVLYNRYFKNRNINSKDAKTIIKRLNEKINSSSDEELENYINNLMRAYDKQREKYAVNYELFKNVKDE